mgnify:CR=1 FL=1
MYYPVPGHSHLKVLVPDVPKPVDSRPPGRSPGRLSQAALSGKIGGPAPDPSELAAVSPLVRVALDAAFGIRDIRTLQKRSFSYGVRAHVRARRRTGAPPAGAVRVLSAHARGEGEYHGTATSEGRNYAWVARMKDGRLHAFRVL